MDKKVLALLIVGVIVLVAGGYASYYAYASVVLIPEDVNTFKSELDSLENGTIIPESDIKEIENVANQLESGQYVLVSDSERKKVADDMRNDPFFVSLNSSAQEIKNNFTNNQNIASRYDILLKGSVANQIRNIYSDELSNTTDKLIQIAQKLPNDIENGNKTLIIADFREMASIGRQLNNQAAAAKINLQNVINELEG